ncbi:MAG: amino acid adenylation domain-containing protein, partial [Alteromonadaceae bacterium]
ALIDKVKSHIALPFDLSAEPAVRFYHYFSESNDDSENAPNEEAEHLLMMFHHIAFDGWSMDIFIQELGEVYQALTQNRAANLPTLDINYGDFALWQRQFLQGENLDKLLAFWQRELAGFETLDLITDHPHPAKIDYYGKEFAFALDAQLSEQLRELAKMQHTTVYTVLLSGFYVALMTLSGQTDVVVGTPSDNRHHAQTQSLIGFFVNTLALRADVDKSQSINALITQVHGIITRAKVHQELPFEQLVDALDIERDTSRHPLFQVMFSVQNFDENGVGGPLPFTPVSEDVLQGDSLYSPAKFDLSVFLTDAQSQISGVFNYAVSLFEQSTIERLSAVYQRILTAFVDNKQQTQPIAQINLLSPAERQTLLFERERYDWHKTPVSSAQTTLHQLFESQARKTPNNVAVIFEQQQLTYQQLNEKANQLARVIVQSQQDHQGETLKPDTLVALYLNRSIEMVVSILAVLKAGGAYVPISPEYPQSRTMFILSDTKAPLLLTQKRHLESLQPVVVESPQALQLLAVDDEQLTEGCASDDLVTSSSAKDLAYVIYTSGTTGTPKGVMLTQGALSYFIVQAISYLSENSPDDIADQGVSTMGLIQYTFDPFGLDYGVSLLSGGRLVLSNVHSAQADLFEHQANINLIVQTPSMWQMLLADPEFVAMDKSRLKSIQIIVGGESAGEDLYAQLDDVFAQVHQVYGPTETCIGSTVCVYKPGDAHNIGQPFAGEQAYVLSDTLQPLPIGAPGELYIGGAGLARGYLNRPELTAEAFIDNPFEPVSADGEGQSKLYKTGDLVRRLSTKDGSAGDLVYMGRNDFQVKIRGHRIEPGEIEGVLVDLPQVKQAVVIDVDRQGSKALAAYIVLQWGQTVATADLIDSLTAKLPAHMVPDSFTMVDQIPLTLNGKVDVQSLPEPQWASLDTYVSPRNEVEQQLCDIWQEVLGLEQVGVEDNFFRIGGNSITAIRLLGVVGKAFDMDVPLALLFEHNNIAGLALHLEGHEQIVIPALGQNRYPLSFAQQRMWFVEQFEQGTDAYHIPYFVQLKRADIDLLAAAFNVVINRHPVLKTVYINDENGH